MTPDDLRHALRLDRPYSDDDERKAKTAALLSIAAIFGLFVLNFLIATYASPQAVGSPPPSSPPRSAVDAPLCPLLRGTTWLQASIVHREESGRITHACLYGRQWSAL